MNSRNPSQSTDWADDDTEWDQLPTDLNDNHIDVEDEWLDRLADEVASHHRPRSERKGRRSRPSSVQHQPHVEPLVSESEDLGTTGLVMTYQPSRHEALWLKDAVGPFLTENLITDVLRQVKGGKEACVYLCAAHPSLAVPYLAAKVYRPRQLRNLRNDALYRHGRAALDADGKLLKDSRAIHALQAGTSVGQQMRHTSWLSHEFKALQRLFEAGADVPRPYAVNANAVLMTYLGDRRQPAHPLNHTRLARREAEILFRRTLDNVERMLAMEMIHGDLSAYNILYWRGNITLIDFPQVVSPYQNPAAKSIFGRDMDRVCQYFAASGLDLDAREIADRLWSRHVHGETWSEFPLVDLEAMGEGA